MDNPIDLYEFNWFQCFNEMIMHARVNLYRIAVARFRSAVSLVSAPHSVPCSVPKAARPTPRNVLAIGGAPHYCLFPSRATSVAYFIDFMDHMVIRYGNETAL
jgi:hypothetical protein